MASTDPRNRLWAIASLAVLILAGWQAFGALARTPAFNPALRVETAADDGLLRDASAMYSRGAYHYRVALGWRGAAFAAGRSGGDADVTAEHWRRVLEISTEGLRHAPGDAAAWMLVAWSEAEVGTGENALLAWFNAQELSPHFGLRAADRLAFLTRFMETPENRALALSMISPDIVQADLETMRRVRRLAERADLLAQNPHIAAFLDGTSRSE